jgi:hypothetical protein
MFVEDTELFEKILEVRKKTKKNTIIVNNWKPNLTKYSDRLYIVAED